MNTAAASLPAVSASASSSAAVIRVTAPSAAAVPHGTRVSVTTGHGRWLATAAAIAIVVLTALTIVLNALEAREGAEYGVVAANGAATASASTIAR